MTIMCQHPDHVTLRHTRVYVNMRHLLNLPRADSASFTSIFKWPSPSTQWVTFWPSGKGWYSGDVCFTSVMSWPSLGHLIFKGPLIFKYNWVQGLPWFQALFTKLQSAIWSTSIRLPNPPKLTSKLVASCWVINQSTNQTSIGPISPEKPGSVAQQPSQCSTAKYLIVIDLGTGCIWCRGFPPKQLQLPSKQRRKLDLVFRRIFFCKCSAQDLLNEGVSVGLAKL